MGKSAAWVAFASNTFKDANCGYSIGKSDGIACISWCEHSSYLNGRHFSIRTDQSALTSLLSDFTSGPRQLRLIGWVERLNQYTFSGVYPHGKDNVVPDHSHSAIHPPSEIRSRTHSDGSFSSVNSSFQFTDTSLNGTSLVHPVSPKSRNQSWPEKLALSQNSSG